MKVKHCIISCKNYGASNIEHIFYFVKMKITQFSKPANGLR